MSEIAGTDLSQPFKNVLQHFVERDIGLVVRLNSELYCPTYFTALGVQHVDMIFDDGTCPALPVVKKFIRLASNQIARKKGIAVHCKAGLGRTGCLIGAYLIYRYGFSANEVIAFMRFMRPGMVVGPQQHWLHLNQGQFREWYIEDQLKQKMALEKPTTPKPVKQTPLRHHSTSQVATPPPKSSQQRAALGEIDGNDTENAYSYHDENLPAPTPGQPRKYARMDSRNHPYARSTSGMHGSSPRRSVSHTITTTTETVSIFEDDTAPPASPVRMTKTRSPSRRSGGEDKSKVRKTSARIGSVNRSVREV